MPASSWKERLPHLSGWEIVAPGLADVAAGRVTVAACVIWIAAPRLRAVGLLDETATAPAIEP